MEIDLHSQAQLYLGLFEHEVSGWLRRFSKGVRTGIDIGAGQGEYTLYFLVRTPATKVYSFEPALEARRRLQKNAQLNNLESHPRLELSAMSIGSQNSEVSCTLDSIAQQISPPCLIKIDVDGGEVEILRGASRFFDIPGVRWIIETHSHELERECIALLANSGFETTVVSNAWWRIVIPELRPVVQNRWLTAVRRSET